MTYPTTVTQVPITLIDIIHVGVTNHQADSFSRRSANKNTALYFVTQARAPAATPRHSGAWQSKLMTGFPTAHGILRR
eukprot:778349-Pyramimonas_sp.AAC.1